jgi:hypothetical protein
LRTLSGADKGQATVASSWLTYGLRADSFWPTATFAIMPEHSFTGFLDSQYHSLAARY